ncbi:MAG TPA: DUF1244 domain-containing protein [Cellvibrionaceae bacterium]
MSEQEWQAAAFRRLVAHLQERPEVQNIDLMNLAGFCRNCLSKWYQEAAVESGAQVSQDQARALVYGMPYSEYKSRYQTPATPEQQKAFDQSQAPSQASQQQ